MAQIAHNADGVPYFIQKAVGSFGFALLAIAVLLMLVGAGFFIYGQAEGQSSSDALDALAAFGPSVFHSVVGAVIFGFGFLSLLFFLAAEAIRR